MWNFSLGSHDNRWIQNRVKKLSWAGVRVGVDYNHNRLLRFLIEYIVIIIVIIFLKSCNHDYNRNREKNMTCNRNHNRNRYSKSTVIMII